MTQLFHLQNVSDENKNPLDDHPIVFTPFVEILPEKFAQILGQDSPQFFVYESLLVHLEGGFQFTDLNVQNVYQIFCDKCLNKKIN